ncbi:MAG: VanW family protein [Clostridium sp.]
MKKSIWLAGAAAILSTGLLLFSPEVTSAATLPTGITVGGLELGGMTEEEANKKITEYVDAMSKQQITLTIDGHELSTTAQELGFHWDNQKEVEAAAERYSGGNLLERYLDFKRLEKQPISISLQTAVDAKKVSAFTEEQCAPFVRTQQDAGITREGDKFVVTDSVEGLEVDIRATKAAIDAAVQTGLSEPVTVAAVVKVTQPVKTAEALSSISDMLGTFSTNFNGGNVSRSTNLRNGASKVNGYILMPGEEFSAYTCLTPFTAANGYSAAGSYENGRVVDTIGGGACQLCTTLYNAALRAEVEITQRQNHSMVVGYVQPSEDAAIAGTYKDLKFKNNYDTPIYIEGGTNKGTLTFTIYGKETRAANRTIKFVSETLGTIDPGNPTIKSDSSLAPGAKVRDQAAHVGKHSQLWKYVYVDGAETEKTIVSKDTYMASKAIYRVGPNRPAAPEPVAPQPETVPTPPTAQAPDGPASDGPASDIGQSQGPSGPGA